MSIISGEYWIDDSGASTYCDGDVGEKNHEIEAFERAIGIDREEVDFDIYPGNLAIVDAAEDFLENDEESKQEYALDEVGDLDEKEQNKLLRLMGVDEKYLKYDHETALAMQWYDDKGANMKFIQWCLDGGCDARDYALEQMGWIRVKGDNFQVWDFNDDALDSIKNFDEWQNVEDPDNIESSEDEIAIEELSTGWFENIPLKRLFAAKSAAALKRSMTGVAKWHRSGENPRKRRR